MQALAVVKYLLRGQADDSTILEDLAQLLEDDMEELVVAASHEKCTGSGQTASQEVWMRFS